MITLSSWTGHIHNKQFYRSVCLLVTIFLFMVTNKQHILIVQKTHIIDEVDKRITIHL